jgi:hypothetical protein
MTADYQLQELAECFERRWGQRFYLFWLYATYRYCKEPFYRDKRESELMTDHRFQSPGILLARGCCFLNSWRLKTLCRILSIHEEDVVLRAVRP